MTQLFTCLECDHELEVPVLRDPDYGDEYTDIPEECPACGADTSAGIEPSCREDFHSGC